jgi:hypothetical protein
MSLYQNKSGASGFDVIPNIGGRPKWLNISLIIAAMYTLICLTISVIDEKQNEVSHQEEIAASKRVNEPIKRLDAATFALLNATVEAREASFKERQSKVFFKYAILLALAAASIVYIFKCITVIGFFAGGVWSLCLVALICNVSGFEAGFINQMYFVRTYGFGLWMHLVEAIIQILLAMGIYFYSAIKFKPLKIEKDKI